MLGGTQNIKTTFDGEKLSMISSLTRNGGKLSDKTACIVIKI